MKQNSISLEDKYTLRRYLQAILRSDFPSFLHKVFASLNPGKKFVNNWHITYLASLLQEAYEGKHRNIIICVPPRSLKSTIISVAWTAWILGKDPSKRIMAASYSASLSTKLSADTRSIVTSNWYRKLFANFKIAKDQNRKTKFSTTKHGFRLATSVGGATIGEGGDVLIVDDPLSPMQANSKKYRERAISWYKESFSTRLNDKKSGIKVIVMQRLHTDDLVGRLIKSRRHDWKIVSIPAIAMKDQDYVTENFIHNRKQGEYLHEAREGKDEIEQIKKQLGSYAFSAQYQQIPVSEEGNLIKKSWIRRYDILPTLPFLKGQSWDLAFTNKSYSDYSVCTTWHIHKNSYYLSHVYRVQKQFPELIDDCHKLYQKFAAEFIIIEDTVSSKAFIQEVKRRGICRVIARRPVQDKYTRLAILTPVFEAGEVYLPENAEWLADFEDEVLNFPKTPHDDQVDSMTQFLSYAKQLNDKNDGKFISHIA